MAQRLGTALAAAAFLALAPAAAVATTTTADGVEVDTMVEEDTDDGDMGLWGLLGLLGLLAPLFNKKSHDDVHVNRTTTTHTAGRNDGNPLT